MAKIRVKNLPEGFEIKNGKVVKKLSRGGVISGDQSDYSLVTTYRDNDRYPDQQQVRFSLSAVPREIANIEAEGGETVLTDLNDDGTFGLYNIVGPRHSRGGVPMFLPPQSFIFSDTNDMKLDRIVLREFDINSRKKMTPAKVSKKFDLNKYYAEIEDEFADEIQARSADMMLDKNKMQLSKLSFIQESNKNFEDGVPVTSYPFLLSQNIDPLLFTQQVEEINRKQAEEKLISSLPAREEMQIRMMQEMMQQAQNNPAEEQVIADQGLARYGRELPKAQTGNAETTQDPEKQARIAAQSAKRENPYLTEEDISNLYNQYLNYYSGNIPTEDRLDALFGDLFNFNPDLTYYDKLEMYNDYVKNNLGKSAVTVPTSYMNEVAYQSNQPSQPLSPQPTTQTTTQPTTQATPSIDIPKGLTEEEAYFKALELYEKAEETRDPNDILTFQKFYHEYYPEKAKEILAKEPLTTYGKKKGLTKEDLESNEDSTWGRRTRAYFNALTPPDIPETPTNQRPEKASEEVVEDEKLQVSPEDANVTYRPPNPEFWLQDLIGLDALNRYRIRLGLPWQPDVQTPEVSYTLEDPTRAIAAINEQANIANQAYGMFAGPQSLAARTANASSRAANAVANEIARVNQRNVNVVNQGNARQAQLDLIAGRERRMRQEKLYDDTELALENFNVEKNMRDVLYANKLSEAITNRANTQALNSMMNYFNVSPSTGGMVNLTNPAGYVPSKQTDPGSEITSYANTVKEMVAAGIPPESIKIDPRMFMQQSSPYMNPAQEELYNMSPYMGYKKEGGDVKPYAIPFYTGKMGI